MASNPHWRRSVAEWERQIARWIEVPDEQALLECTIFFDFRALHGDLSLVQPLQERVRTQLSRNDIFLARLTASALRNRPPLGLIRTFVVERGGEHRDTLNLEERGMAPLVDAARVLALGNGITTTNTFERLHAAAEVRALSVELAEDAREAYGYEECESLAVDLPPPGGELCRGSRRTRSAAGRCRRRSGRCGRLPQR